MPAILLTSRVLLLLLLTRLLRLQQDTFILLLLWIPLLTRCLRILLRWLEYLLSCWTPPLPLPWLLQQSRDLLPPTPKLCEVDGNDDDRPPFFFPALPFPSAL